MQELEKRKFALSSISEQLQPIAVVLSPEKNLSLRDLLQQVERNQQCLMQIEKGLKAIEIASRFKSRPPPPQNSTGSTGTAVENSGSSRLTSPPQPEDSRALPLRASGSRPPASSVSSSSPALDRSTRPAPAPAAPTSSSNHTPSAAQSKSAVDSPETSRGSEAASHLYSTIASAKKTRNASLDRLDGVDGGEGVLAADGVVLYDHLTGEPPPSPLVESKEVNVHVDFDL